MDFLAADIRTAARAKLCELLLACADEDRAAFSELYRLTSAKLFGICLRICVSRTLAEDVMVDVYHTVWMRAGAFEPGRASPITWMATIARNRAIDAVRRLGPLRETDLANAPDIADAAPLVDAVLLRDEGERRLHLCLDDLEERQAKSIRAAFFDGLTYAELAVRMAVPLGTMKSWVRRGLLRLRECLDADS